MTGFYERVALPSEGGAMRQSRVTLIVLDVIEDEKMKMHQEKMA